MSRYTSEKALTTKQNKTIFEEAYMRREFARANDDTFAFKYPQKFSTNPSMDKSISPRRVKLIPLSVSFNLGVEYSIFANGVSTSQEHLNPLRFEFLSQNTMREILHEIINDFAITGDDGKNYSLRAEYTSGTGELRFYPVCSNLQANETLAFRFACPSYEDYLSFWHLLNQDSTTPFPGILNDENWNESSLMFCEEYSLSNVWSREQLYVHASFSDSYNHFMCLTGDYWEKPGKLFKDNATGSDFTIYFTTNGYNRISPVSANILLELAFIIRTDKLT